MRLRAPVSLQLTREAYKQLCLMVQRLWIVIVTGVGAVQEGQDSKQELVGAAVGHSKLGTAHKHTGGSIRYRRVYRQSLATIEWVLGERGGYADATLQWCRSRFREIGQRG